MDASTTAQCPAASSGATMVRTLFEPRRRTRGHASLSEPAVNDKQTNAFAKSLLGPNRIQWTTTLSDRALQRQLLARCRHQSDSCSLWRLGVQENMVVAYLKCILIRRSGSLEKDPALRTQHSCSGTTPPARFMADAANSVCCVAREFAQSQVLEMMSYRSYKLQEHREKWTRLNKTSRFPLKSGLFKSKKTAR